MNVKKGIKVSRYTVDCKLLKCIYLKALILKAVRSNLPGDTGNLRQNVGSAISMSLDFSSLAFQLAPIFKLFNLMLSFAFAIVVVVDDAVDDVAAELMAPSPTDAAADDTFGICFWYKIRMANEIR